MGDFEFVGQFDTLSKPQLNLVNEILLERGYKGGKVAIEAVGQKGDNYIAIVKRIIVYQNGVEAFKMIAKVAPTQNMLRQIMKIERMFANETAVYTKVMPTFMQLFDEGKIPKKQRFRVPECYGFICDAPNEIILLEDLKLSGFGILDRLKPLTTEIIEYVLRNLAIFHSISFVLREKNPEKYEEIKNSLQIVWADMDSVKETEEWLNQLEEDTLSVIDDEKYRKFLRGTVSKFCDVIQEEHDYAVASKYCVIQQGDCWTNNIMFRFEDKDIIEACMIDYQISKPASPASDIFYITFNCTDHETRSKHWHKWLNLYHEELDNSLSNFGLNVKNIYPRSELEADLKRNVKLTLTFAIFLSNTLIRTSDEIMDFPEMETQELTEAGDSYRIINMRTETQKVFKDRIMGCIDSVIEFNYV